MLESNPGDRAPKHEKSSLCWITCDILGLLFLQLIRCLNQDLTFHTCSCSKMNAFTTLCGVWSLVYTGVTKTQSVRLNNKYSLPLKFAKMQD